MRADSNLTKMTATSPPAVMCVDAQAVVLFATAEAHKLCELWNSGLTEGAADLRLPAGIGSLLREASNNGCDPIASGVRVCHPNKPELAVTIHRDGPYCLLMFVADAPLAASTESASSAERTLCQLTPSERRVALLVAEGLRNEDIAQRLQRSRRTVEYQLHAIFRKLDMSRRTQLVRVLV